jgi:hypothetical protein
LPTRVSLCSSRQSHFTLLAPPTPILVEVDKLIHPAARRFKDPLVVQDIVDLSRIDFVSEAKCLGAAICPFVVNRAGSFRLTAFLLVIDLLLGN